jgi:hypothetical protein
LNQILQYGSTYNYSAEDAQVEAEKGEILTGTADNNLIDSEADEIEAYLNKMQSAYTKNTTKDTLFNLLKNRPSSVASHLTITALRLSSDSKYYEDDNTWYFAGTFDFTYGSEKSLRHADFVAGVYKEEKKDEDKDKDDSTDDSKKDDTSKDDSSKDDSSKDDSTKS